MSGDARLPRGPQGVQGERGAQGNQGNRGAHGELSHPVRNAVVFLTLLSIALSAAGLLFTAHYVNVTRAAQQRQGAAFEHKICTTLAKLAREKPPAGDPATNPSRAYLQDQHATLAELGPDLGCKA